MAIPERTELLPFCPEIEAWSLQRGPSDPSAPYSGFNACHYVGDSPGHVDFCRRAIAEHLGIDTAHIVIPTQTHSSRVVTIADEPQPLDGVDALVTDRKGTALCINTADCVPVVLADPEASVIGIAHSGWRGTISDIAGATVRAMEALGASPRRIKAAMGPSICAQCYNVGADVARQFTERYGADSGVVEYNDRTPHINLGRAVAINLIRAGLDPLAIPLPAICSYHSDGAWPSARRIGTASVRTLTLIMLR